MFRRTVFALALAASTLAAVGCDLDGVDAAPFEDGSRKLTDRGAFHVELSSVQGAPVVGSNDFVVVVAMPNPNAPDELGWHIPDARVTATAFSLEVSDLAAEASHVTYIGEGRYLVSGLDLARGGAWQLDLDIEVGHTMDEQVTFVFSL